jgi:hypothetical protein
MTPLSRSRLGIPGGADPASEEERNFLRPLDGKGKGDGDEYPALTGRGELEGGYIATEATEGYGWLHKIPAVHEELAKKKEADI